MPGYRRSPAPPTRLFSDIDHHWAAACIAELVAQTLIVGEPNGRFRPDDPMTRAEFATLLYWVFPKSLPIRKAQPFIDVPGLHWANKVVTWVYERGLFSGYANRTFQPSASLSRAQALLVLVNGLHYVYPLSFQDILTLYFDDAAEIPSYAKGAIAAATLAGLVVNYPDVRKLRPRQPITRSEVAALICQILGRSHTIPKSYITWSAGLEEIRGTTLIPLTALRSNPRLVKQIQTHLHVLRLHPGDAALNGKYGPVTETALMEFSQILDLPNKQTYALDEPLAQALLTTNVTCFLLERARDREKIFHTYLQQEKGLGAAHLAFLDKGIQGSPYEAEIKNYATYLVQPHAGSATQGDKPSTVPVVTAPRPRIPPSPRPSAPPPSSQPFPKLGERPAIYPDKLSFLHEDIRYACVCVGRLVDGQLKADWFGKNALANVELWSATKIIPLLNVVSQVNTRFLEADVDTLLIRPRGSNRGFCLYDLAEDMINYRSAFGSSNSLAAMFKQFATPQHLENWLKRITGNTTLVFRGRYGEGAFMQTPELWDQRLKRIILTAQTARHRGDNTLSTYDMTRLITMLAWHPRLPADAQLPGAQWNSLESVIRAMGKDSARYVDVAIAQLGLSDVIMSPSSSPNWALGAVAFAIKQNWFIQHLSSLWISIPVMATTNPTPLQFVLWE